MLFARKDETASTLPSKYNGGTGAMSIDDYARWLGRVTLAVAIVMIGRERIGGWISLVETRIARMVGSSVANIREDTSTSAWLSALNNVDFPALV